MGRRISKEFLHPSILEGVNDKIGNLDSLETDAKGNMVQAINELVEKLDNSAEIENGKELIANAIGEPLTAEESFEEMSNDINSLLSTFKTNMMNNGVTVESGDKFKQLIDKIATMVEENSGKGIQFATGTSVQEAKTITTLFKASIGNTSYAYIRVLFEEIGFTPAILLSITHNSTSSTDSYFNISIYSEIHDGCFLCYASKSSSTYGVSFEMDEIKTDSYIDLPTDIAGAAGYTATWYAIGVGEEDTTLRDSLASILQEEGVNVTEEDNMASLITKVDEEFNDNRNRLYELMSEGGYEVNSGMSIDEMLGLLELSGISVSDIKQISCGYNHTFILKNDGSIWGCGLNTYGQLGLGDTNDRTTFTQVITNINNDIKQISCGYNHTFILKNDGSIWGCGLNTYGQLGLGDVDDNVHSTFTQVITNINNDVNQIACCYDFTFILKNDGSVYSCGRNDHGELGLNDNTYKPSFTQVTTNINNDVKQIACGYAHALILKNDGSLWGCGWNINGELGLNDTATRYTFTQVTTNINNDVKQVACGCDFTVILKNDGSIWSCGYNSAGQLGLGNNTTRKTFTQVTTNINNDVKQISFGYNHTFILKNDGSIWGCGYNGSGQLGLGDTTNRKTFTKVTTNINNDVKQIACGVEYTFILKNDGTIWACGWNSSGELGLGDNTAYNTFTMIPRGLY